MPIKLDKFVIKGGKRLSGTIKVSGSKNAALPLMTATLLAPGKFELNNTPNLTDIKTMSRVLKVIGAEVEQQEHEIIIDSTKCKSPEVPYELMKTMRASIYALGPLLARFGEAKVSLPGGCAWGPRPVDLHLKGMEKLGAKIELDGGYIFASAKKLKGAYINLDVSSVGATGNIIMAGVLAEGKTIIENSAREPEITELARFLNKMGAKIEGIGTDTIEIEGVTSLHPANETVIPDRIEAGTFLIASAITGGELKLENCFSRHLLAVITKLEEAGITVMNDESTITIKSNSEIKPVDVVTAIYPGFPTDMQAQWIALMSLANGSSRITDTIYFDRFTHVPELNRLGANIELDKNTAIVRGVKRLKSAPVMSTDLRASASLILAGLAAKGTTEVLRVYHIDRGYERIEEKLKQIGADIIRAEGSL
jgi:UDP-N-acetylglucosamine 1-carboxyvinyltransferase